MLVAPMVVTLDVAMPPVDIVLVVPTVLAVTVPSLAAVVLSPLESAGVEQPSSPTNRGTCGSSLGRAPRRARSEAGFKLCGNVQPVCKMTLA